MRKSIALLALLAVISAAQAQNWTGAYDTSTITSFKADSIKYGKVALMERENQMFVYATNDTNAAGFANDSCAFKCGYRRGAVILNSSGKLDTTWRSIVWLDSLKLTGATTKIITATSSASFDSATCSENYVPGMIDTLWVSGYAVLTCPFAPIWSPLIQPVIKGLSDNRVGGWVKVFVTYLRRQYQNVRTN
jgi:hypothetical protein